MDCDHASIHSNRAGPHHVPNGNQTRSVVGSATLLTVVIVVAVLYFARLVLIPIALALLLAFLLAPLVVRVRRLGLGKIPSVALVVVCTFLAIGTFTTVMIVQVSDLAHRMPEYEQNVKTKMASVRDSGGGFVARLTRLIRNVTEDLTPSSASVGASNPNEEKPVPVEIRRGPFSPIEIVQKLLGSVLNAALMAGIVVVFVIFMLAQREDLRDRLLRLAGEGRVHLTTQVFDDAAQRVSRYLLAQLALNVGFGLLAGIGLYFIGVPNPLLWGMLAAVLRYIPYLGIWMAAVLPAAMAFAVEPGWVKAPGVFALYLGIDLLMYNFAEPLLYGSSTGVSPLAILVAAVFWTWLWGPVGLLLATPLTVCVVVLGRYVPQLHFLSVILSDEEVLSPETRFYQRMLAMDLDEATEVAEEHLRKGKSLEELFDTVLIPALSMAEAERHRGALDDTRQKFIFQSTRILIEHLTDSAEIVAHGEAPPKLRSPGATEPRPKMDTPQEVCVLCVPARDEADELAAIMLSNLLLKKGVTTRSMHDGVLAGECLEEVAKSKPKLVCVTAVPPFGFMHARYLCRRLQDQFSDLKVVASILSEGNENDVRLRQPAIKADEVSCTLAGTVRSIMSLLPLTPAVKEGEEIAA